MGSGNPINRAKRFSSSCQFWTMMQKRASKPLRSATVNRETNTLRSIFSKAVEWEGARTPDAQRPAPEDRQPPDAYPRRGREAPAPGGVSAAIGVDRPASADYERSDRRGAGHKVRGRVRWRAVFLETKPGPSRVFPSGRRYKRCSTSVPEGGHLGYFPTHERTDRIRSTAFRTRFGVRSRVRVSQRVA